MSKFFQDDKGNSSSTRLIGFEVINWALILTTAVLYFGKDHIVGASIAAGSMFTIIAGPVMIFLFKQKQNEADNNG